MMKTKITKIPRTFAAFVGLTASASATLVVYEPFDYPDTGPSDGANFLGDGSQGGGLGLTQWRQANSRADNTNEIEVSVPGLGFTDGGGNTLPTSGGYAVRTQRVGQNSISSNLTDATLLTTDNSSMWMSFLYVDNGFSGPDSAIALASQDIIASDSQALAAPGFGVGIAFEPSPNSTRSIATAVYNGSTGSTKVLEATPTFAVAGGPEFTSFLLAAKINWKPDGELDEIFVFNITDLTAEPAEGDAIASDTFDMSLVNQQALNILTIGETQVDGFDEIRLGTSFADVVPIPEPSSMTLAGLAGLMLMRRRR